MHIGMTLENTNNFIVDLKMDAVLVVQFEIGSLEVELHSGYGTPLRRVGQIEGLGVGDKSWTLVVYGTIGAAIWVNINIEEIINMTIVIKVVIKLIGKIEVHFIDLSFLCQERW